MEQKIGGRGQGVGSRERKIEDREQGESRGGVTPPLQTPYPPPPTPRLKEIDRLRLERTNLSISNLNLQLALLNERARALQIETAGFRAEREGLVKALHHEDAGLDGKWRLNPDTMIFEAVGAALGTEPQCYSPGAPPPGPATAQKEGDKA